MPLSSIFKMPGVRHSHMQEFRRLRAQQLRRKTPSEDDDDNVFPITQQTTPEQQPTSIVRLPSEPRTVLVEQDDDEGKNESDHLRSTITKTVTMSHDEDSPRNDNYRQSTDSPSTSNESTPKPTTKASLFAMMGIADRTTGYLSGLDMSEEVAMSLLDSSLISISPDRRTATATTPGTSSTIKAVLGEWTQLDEWTKEEEDPLNDGGSQQESEASSSTPDAQQTPFSVFRHNANDLALHDSRDYIQRIAKLEAALAEARNELEQQTQSLRSKDGEILSSPDVLWQRNKTLVKEVRFADQTCVELSGQKQTLEKEITLLHQQLQHERTETSKLLNDLKESNRSLAKTEAELEATSNAFRHSQATRDKLYEQLEVFQGTVAENRELVDTVERLQKEKASVERLSTAATERCERLEIRASELAMQERDSTFKLMDATSERSRLQGELAEAQESLGMLNREVELWIVSAQNSEADRLQLQKRVDELEESENRQRVALKSMSDSLVIEKESKEALLEESSRLSARIMELVSNQVDVDSVEDQLRYERERLALLETELRERAVALKIQVNKLEQLVSENASLQAQIAETSAADRQLRSELEVALRTGSQAAEACKMLQACISERGIELNLAVAGKDRLQGELANSESTAKAIIALLEQEKAEIQKKLDICREQMEQSQFDLVALKNDCECELPVVAARLVSAVAGMTEQANAVEVSVDVQTNQMVNRMSDLEKTLSYLKQCIVFEDASEQQSEQAEDSDSADLSALTSASSENVSDGDGAEIAPAETEEVILNATFDRTCVGTMDLELMEEARSETQITTQVVEDMTLSREVSAVTEDDLSTIAGISHLFSPSGPDLLSVSLSRSAVIDDSPQFGSSPLLQPSTLSSHVSGELETLKVQIAAVSNERDCLRAKVEDFREALVSIDTALQGCTLNDGHFAQKGLIRMEADVDLIKVGIEDLLRTKESALDECEKLRGQLKSAEAESLAGRNGARVASDDLQAFKLRYDSLSEKFEALNERIADRNRQFEGLAAERDDLLARLESVADTFAGELSEVKTELAHSEEQRFELLSEIAVLERQRGELQNEVVVLSGRVESLTKDLSVSEHQKGSIDENCRCLRQALEEITLEKAETDMACEELEARVRFFQDSHREVNRRLCESTAAAVKDLGIVRSESDNVTKESSQEALELSELSVHVEMVIEKLSAKIEELEDAKEGVERKLNCANDELEEVHERCGRLQAASEQSLEDSRAYEEKLRRSQASYVSLQTDCAASRQQNKELGEIQGRLEGEIEELRKALAAAEDLGAISEERLISAQSEVETLRSELTLAQNACSETEQLLKSAEDDNALLRQYLGELQEERQYRDFVPDSVESSSSEGSHTRTTQSINEREDWIRSSANKFSKYEEDIVHLRVALEQEELKNLEMEASKHSLEAKCRRLRQYVHKVTAKCQEWENYCSRQGETLTKLKTSNERAQKKVVEIAQQYQDRDEFHSAERNIWTVERSTLNALHNQLESELDEIERELVTFSRP